MDRLLFSNGTPTRDQIELFDLIDSYMAYRCPAWTALVERVQACGAVTSAADPALELA